MPTPVTVEIKVDATGAIAGSAQAQQAITSAVNNISGATQKMGVQTATTSRLLERFGDAPKRGISALDALNATVIQATGGFQALGPASAAASTGLRTALFAVSSFLGPVGTITVALSGLAAVFAFTSANANKLSDELKISTQELRSFAVEGGQLAAFAISNISDKATKLQAEIKTLSTDLVILQTGLSVTPFGVFNIQLGDSAKKALELKEKILALTNALDELGQPRHATQAFDLMAQSAKLAIDRQKELAETQERLFQLSTQGIATNQAVAVSVEAHNQAILQGIELEKQAIAQRVAQATTVLELNALQAQMIRLIQEERALRLAAATDSVTAENIKLKAVIDSVQTQVAANQQAKQIQDEINRKNKATEQSYREIGQAIENSLTMALLNSANAAERLHNALVAILIDLGKIAGAALGKQLFGTAVGGAIGGPVGAFVGGTIGGLFRESPSSGSAALPALSAPVTNSAINVTIHVNSLDAKTTAQAMSETVIPAIKRAVLERRVSF